MKFNEKDIVKIQIKSLLEYLDNLSKTGFIKNIISASRLFKKGVLANILYWLKLFKAIIVL